MVQYVVQVATKVLVGSSFEKQLPTPVVRRRLMEFIFSNFIYSMMIRSKLNLDFKPGWYKYVNKIKQISGFKFY